MEKGKRLLKGTGIVAVLAAVLISGAVVWAVERSTAAGAELRADLIALVALEQFGPTERPMVVYRHDQHTEAITKMGKDCAACHLKDEKGRMSPKYMRLKDVDRFFRRWTESRYGRRCSCRGRPASCSCGPYP